MFDLTTLSCSGGVAGSPAGTGLGVGGGPGGFPGQVKQNSRKTHNSNLV